MPHLLAFDLDAVSWKSRESLPSDRFVLARIEHYSGTQPPKIVFAKATSDGIALGSGDELNFDWHVAGWLEQDICLELAPPGAAQAAVRPLQWEELSSGQRYAKDEFGGHYHYDPARPRLVYECDETAYLGAATEQTYIEAAEAHHARRVKRALGGA